MFLTNTDFRRGFLLLQGSSAGASDRILLAHSQPVLHAAHDRRPNSSVWNFRLHVDRRQHSDFTQYNIWVGPGLQNPSTRLPGSETPSNTWATSDDARDRDDATAIGLLNHPRQRARCCLLRHSTPKLSTPARTSYVPVSVWALASCCPLCDACKMQFLVCRTQKGLIF